MKEPFTFFDDPEVIDAIAKRCRSTAVVAVVEMCDSMHSSAREIRRLQARIRELEGSAHEWRDLKHDPPVNRWELAILYSPPESLSDDPNQRPDIRIAAPNRFTWATHWLPLSILPTLPGRSETE